MTQNISVTLSADRIRAAAGQKVSIGALFDSPVYVTVYEAGREKGWQCLERFKEKMRVLDYEVVVHADTKLFDIVASPDGVAGIEDHEHSVEVAVGVDVLSDTTSSPGTEPVQEPEPVPEPTPEPESDAKDLGAYRYKYVQLGDIHMCKETPSDPSKDWGDEADFNAAMEKCVADPEIKFVSSCGDVAESQTNEAGKHPESVCDADYAEFKEMYDVLYWQVAGLRFFSCLGNHDYYGIFESRNGDEIIGKKNSETIIGYNAGVFSRLGLWPTDQQINGIVPGRGRIVFELEQGKSDVIGQNDMRFFSSNDYVDLYAKKGGYAGDIWDSNKGGISDEAIRVAKQYVNNNWAAVKDSLVMWNSGGGHGRNGYSKFNYWLKKEDDIYIYLSVDYGDDDWGVTDTWHDRVIHARHIIDVNSDDPYIRRMLEFVADTGYSKADEPYNYQYYSPNALIWLKELLENNTDKKIQVTMHHSLPHRPGNDEPIDDALPKDGGWSYAVIYPDGVTDGEGKNLGSNTITGITFWFLNKLFSMYRNVIVYTGHIHKTGENKYHVDNRDYPVVMPSTGSPYIYTKDSMVPKEGYGAWIVSLPSLSKPKLVSNGKEYKLYKDAEMTIVEVYENGVIIKCYKIIKDGLDVYDPDKPLIEKVIILK